MKKSTVKTTKIMTKITTMTNPTPAKAARRTGASRNSKLLSASLAVATGVGVAGMVAVRMAQDASAQDSATVTTEQTIEVTTSSDGYTKDQLDSYAEALSAEATRLQDYRDKLAATATKSQSKELPTIKSKVQEVAQPKAATTTKPAPAAAPAPKVQKEKPAPQSKSQSS